MSAVAVSFLSGADLGQPGGAAAGLLAVGAALAAVAAAVAGFSLRETR
jgi:hypothetical protein